MHHIHADTSAIVRSELLCGAEAGTENNVQDFSLAESLRLFRLQQSQFDGLEANLGDIHAPPIVADFHDDLIALVISIEPDSALRRLAQALAFFWRFDAMTYCISYHVSQRLGDGVENPFFQIRIFPTHPP